MIASDLSKPPPSAARPPHRARKLSIDDIATCANPIVPSIVPEIVPTSARLGLRNRVDRSLRHPIRRQRFFLKPSIPASYWDADTCVAELDSDSVAITRSARRLGRLVALIRHPESAPVYETAAFDRRRVRDAHTDRSGFVK